MDGRKNHNLSTVWFWNPVQNDGLCVQTFAKATPRTTWKPSEKTQLSKEPIWNSLLLPGMAWPTCPTNRCLGLPRVTKLPQTRHAAASEVYFRAVLMIYWLALLHQTPEPQQVPPCHIPPTICRAQSPNRRCAAKVTSICSEVSVFVLAKAPQHQFLCVFLDGFLGNRNHEKVGKLPNINDEF